MAAQPHSSARSSDIPPTSFLDDSIPPQTLQVDASDHTTRHDEMGSKSNNPYRQHTASSAASLARSVSQETEQSFLGIRKKTPARAVFDDLTTAHLSITTGSARSRSREATSSLPEIPGEEDSIPLQDLSSKLSDDLIRSFPSPPQPAVIRSGSLSQQRVPGKYTPYVGQSLSTQPDENALISTPPPNNRRDKSDSIAFSQWPQSRNNLGVNQPTLGSDTSSDSPAVRPQNPRQKAAPFGGSTVVNIYQHYISSDDGSSENELTDSRSESRKISYHLASNNTHSPFSVPNIMAGSPVLNVRKQRPVDRLMTTPRGQPPSFELPAVPRRAPKQTFQSISQGIEPSSSYGDTKNLLDVTQRSCKTEQKSTLSRSEARSDLRSEQTVSLVGDSPGASLPALNSNNPFQFSYGHQPTIHPSYNDNCIYDSGLDFGFGSTDRQPLEQEVSLALRRASGFSAYSNHTVSSSVLQFENLERDAPKPTITTSRQGLNIKDHFPTGLGASNRDTRNALGSAPAFYNEGAIPDTWIATHQHNVVRVPINHNGAFPNSPPETPLEPLDRASKYQDHRVSKSDSEEDANDWETVGESRFGTGLNDNMDTFILSEDTTIHSTGSSIANTSDDGSDGVHISEDEFGSRERITKHPATIRYSKDYRGRDLKNTRIPFFAPVYREHKVNGYLAGSTRNRPPTSPFSYIPRPLASPHTNPFKSPPPEVLSTRAARRNNTQKRNQRRRPRPNYFPPSSKSLTSTGEGDLTGQGMESLSSAMTPTIQIERERTARKLNFVAEPENRGSARGQAKRQFLSPINPVGRPDRPSSWQHMMIFGRGDTVEGYNADGTPITDSSTIGDGESPVSKLQSKGRTDGLIDQRRYPGPRRMNNVREYEPLVRGPPGALYRGIARSNQDNIYAGPFDPRGRAARIPGRYNIAKDYPTNALRPLSLLADRPKTPMEAEDRTHFEGTGPHGFRYRSPLAPPRRASWQKLYTEAQLKSMREAAAADGFTDIPLDGSDAGVSNRDLRMGSSYSYPSAGPRLHIWARESSVRLDLCEKKKKLSIIVLTFCTLFPPLLFFFALGRLDRLIKWWTRGELSSFGKCQKGWATVMILCWGFVLMLVLIVSLVFRFTPPQAT